jgi:nucleotide-binding universal stress UspA family protein
MGISEGDKTMLETVLIPLDGSTLAECVLPHGIAIAQTFNAHIVLLRILEERSFTDTPRSVDPLNWHIRKSEARAYLDSVAMRVEQSGLPVQSVILEGRAADQIVAYADSNDIDLIMLSSHGQSGLSDWSVSSIAEKVTRRANTSLMLVRANQPDQPADTRYRRLLVPLDGSRRAEYTLPIATALARNYRSELLLAHVVTKPEMARRTPPGEEDIELVNRLLERNRDEGARYLDELQARLRSDTFDIRTRLLVGEYLTDALHDLVAQESADLVIMSAHGFSGEPRWHHGRVVSSFIDYGTTPLLIIQDLPIAKGKVSRVETVRREFLGY